VLREVCDGAVTDIAWGRTAAQAAVLVCCGIDGSVMLVDFGPVLGTPMTADASEKRIQGLYGSSSQDLLRRPEALVESSLVLKYLQQQQPGAGSGAASGTAPAVATAAATVPSSSSSSSAPTTASTATTAVVSVNGKKRIVLAPSGASGASGASATNLTTTASGVSTTAESPINSHASRNTGLPYR
jgi:hypothetical protein